MLNEVDPAANRSTGNGSTNIFAYTFEISSESEIEVLVDLVVKTLTTDYTVSGVGASGGGNVTFVSAPANGTTATLSADHRASDGHRGALFLTAVDRLLQTPDTL